MKAQFEYVGMSFGLLLSNKSEADVRDACVEQEIEGAAAFMRGVAGEVEISGPHA